MKRVVVVLFLVVAVINLLPIVGVLSAARLESLYSIPVAEPNLEIAMRHRAVTIAVVGALLAFAAFQPVLRPVAYAAGFVSMVSFVGLVLAVGGANTALTRVFWIDVAAIGLLAVAWGLERFGAGAAT